MKASRHLAVSANQAPVPGRLSIRRHLATTPGRLRLAAGLLALGAVVFGFVAADAAGTRRDAVQDVEATGELLVKAVDLSAHLSDAHATAAFSFLVGGPEPAQTRRDYARARDEAGLGVANLAGEIGTSSRGGPEVRRITRMLPVYAGLIDSARANFRRGLPLGSAYLRAASEKLRIEMLPSARRLYETQAQNLTSSYKAGVSAWTMLAVVLAGCALLALLAATQVYLARTTRRIVNPLLGLATVLLLGLMGWIVGAFALQQRDLAQAQSGGSDPVELLTAARIMASRAQAFESVSLSARGGGGGELRLADVDRGFQTVTAPIRGLLRQTADIAGRSSGVIDQAYLRYLEAHRRVVQQERVGRFTTAVRLAVGPVAGGISTKDAADALSRALDEEIANARDSFRGRAARAESVLGGLSLGIPLLTAACAVLALLGVRQRLEEYR